MTLAEAERAGKDLVRGPVEMANGGSLDPLAGDHSVVLGGHREKWRGDQSDMHWTELLGSVKCDPFRAHSGTAVQESVSDNQILASEMDDGEVD